MKRLRLIVLVLVLVLGCLAIACFRAREPRYQGRTLSEWIESTRHCSETEPQWQNASHAVKQMASNAIPILLDWVRSEDSPQKAKDIYWINENAPFHFHVRRASERRDAASTGFSLLGSDAKPAWPALVDLTFSRIPELRYDAFWCLVFSEADNATLLPVLTRLVHDPDGVVQKTAAR